MILEFQSVSKTFVQGDATVDALKEVKLKIKRNSTNIIIGPSGSGKSTIISLASLMTIPTAGEIIINGNATSNLPTEDMSLIRRGEIGIIYQRENLFPFLNLRENVAVPLISKEKKIITNTLNSLGLTDLDKFPQQISLFGQQKVALARAVINNPSIILADEPTGELDFNQEVEYLNLLNIMADHCAVLVVSDNQNLMEYFENVYFLEGCTLKRKG